MRPGAFGRLEDELVPHILFHTAEMDIATTRAFHVQDEGMHHTAPPPKKWPCLRNWWNFFFDLSCDGLLGEGDSAWPSMGCLWNGVSPAWEGGREGGAASGLREATLTSKVVLEAFVLAKSEGASAGAPPPTLAPPAPPPQLQIPARPGLFVLNSSSEVSVS